MEKKLSRCRSPHEIRKKAYQFAVFFLSDSDTTSSKSGLFVPSRSCSPYLFDMSKSVRGFPSCTSFPARLLLLRKGQKRKVHLCNGLAPLLLLFFFFLPWGIEPKPSRRVTVMTLTKKCFWGKVSYTNTWRKREFPFLRTLFRLFVALSLRPTHTTAHTDTK